jgi:hypothetical protein
LFRLWQLKNEDMEVFCYINVPRPQQTLFCPANPCEIPFAQFPKAFIAFTALRLFVLKKLHSEFAKFTPLESWKQLPNVNFDFANNCM